VYRGIIRVRGSNPVILGGGMHYKPLCSLILLGLLPFVAHGDVAQSILEKTRAKQLERWEGVDTYSVEQSLAGNRVTLHFQRVEVKGPDGKQFTMFEPVRQGSAGAGSGAGGRDGGIGPDGRALTPGELEQFAQGMEMTGAGLATGIEDGLEQAGLPRGLLAATGSDPTATFDPRVMLGANAEFIRYAAQGEKDSAAQRLSDQQESAQQMAQFAEKARLVGLEQVDGRDAFHLRVDGLNQTQKSEGGEEFTLQSVSLWIDSSEYVPLRTKMDGIARGQEGERPITIERLDADYRAIPGSKMYESHRQVMRFAGVMSPAQQQEMREAQAKMAELDQQLAAMPASQRQMIMQRMGPQLQMMKSMADGGGVEMVTEVHQITVNPAAGAGRPVALPPTASPAAAAVAAIPAAAGSATAAAPGTPSAADAARQAQEACLQEKMAKAQSAQKKKRGLGSLVSAASRAAGLLGNQDFVRKTAEVHSASAAAGDLASAARDLGITEDEIAACQKAQ
jgi:hypothetical protein